MQFQFSTRVAGGAPHLRGMARARRAAAPLLAPVLGGLLVLATLVIGVPVVAQTADAVAIRSVETRTSGWLRRTTTVEIGLDAAVPFRVGTGDDGRVAVHFAGVDAASRPAFSHGETITRLALTRTDTGAELILTAERALDLQTAVVTPVAGGGAVFTATFAVGARRAGQASVLPEPVALDLPLVVLDPGHGGVDPGAVREGISEKDIALSFGRELAEVLRASGRFEVAMTREDDRFISLRERVRFAREAEATVFISLHANTVTRGSASGAAIYTLSEGATSEEARALAALENRADTLGGAELGAEDDDLALLLTDMAQRETNARSAMLARASVEAMRHAVGVIRTNPHRSAGFRVLKAPDVPSMLLELGFLSDDTDRENMISPRWRAHAAEGILAALDDWVERDRVLAARAASAEAVTPLRP